MRFTDLNGLLDELDMPEDPSGFSLGDSRYDYVYAQDAPLLPQPVESVSPTLAPTGAPACPREELGSDAESERWQCWERTGSPASSSSGSSAPPFPLQSILHQPSKGVGRGKPGRPPLQRAEPSCSSSFFAPASEGPATIRHNPRPSSALPPPRSRARSQQPSPLGALAPLPLPSPICPPPRPPSRPQLIFGGGSMRASSSSSPPSSPPTCPTSSTASTRPRRASRASARVTTTVSSYPRRVNSLGCG